MEFSSTAEQDRLYERAVHFAEQRVDAHVATLRRPVRRRPVSTV